MGDCLIARKGGGSKEWYIPILYIYATKGDADSSNALSNNSYFTIDVKTNKFKTLKIGQITVSYSGGGFSASSKISGYIGTTETVIKSGTGSNLTYDISSYDTVNLTGSGGGSVNRDRQTMTVQFKEIYIS